MRKTTTYADTCNIHCTNNNKEMLVEILNFKPEAFIDVSVNRSVKVTLRYEKAPNNHYVGMMAGLEFTTKGPKALS